MHPPRKSLIIAGMLRYAIIIDDHAITAHGLKFYIERNFSYTVVFTGDSEASLNAFLEQQSSSFVPEETFAITDLRLKNAFSFGIIQKLSSMGVKVIVYSMFDESYYVEKAKDAGASTYLLKGDSPEKLKEVLHSLESKSPAAENTAGGTQETEPDEEDMSMLTKREKQVADFIREGMTNSEISAIMNLSQRTIENYVSRIYDKTFTSSRQELLQKLRAVGGG